MLRQLWLRWKVLATKIGNFQGRVILTLFYFVFVTPLGVVIRLFADPLHIKSHTGSTFWKDKVQPESTLEEARQQG